MQLAYGSDIMATETIVRDANGLETERRTTSPNREDTVLRIAFDGTFGVGAECGVAPAAPPGLPEDVRSIWFDITP